MIGRNVKINQMSGMPQMGLAFTNWFNDISLVKITTTIDDYEAVNSEEVITFKGVIQPLQPEALKLKPEEQRSWNWLQIHCLPDVILKTGDKILYNDVRFKVMAYKNYKLNNYIEYHLVEDYTDAN